MTRKLYETLAMLIGAAKRCEESGNVEWRDRHRERIECIVRDRFPSGSGFDNGTKIDLGESTEEKLVFHTSFHHMNEHGYYDGWTEHTVRVYPSLADGFRTTISGPNRNEIKDLIGDMFSDALAAVDTQDENENALRLATRAFAH